MGERMVRALIAATRYACAFRLARVPNCRARPAVASGGASTSGGEGGGAQSCGLARRDGLRRWTEDVGTKLMAADARGRLDCQDARHWHLVPLAERLWRDPEAAGKLGSCAANGLDSQFQGFLKIHAFI